MKALKQTAKCMIAMCAMVVACMTMGLTAEAAVVGLQQAAAEESAFGVVWSPAGVSSVYGVEVATDAAFTNVVKRGNTQEAAAAVYGLAPASTYYVRVGVGTSSNDCYANWSNSLQVVTSPKAVTNLKFVDANETQATIEYSPSAGADTYCVWNVKDRQLGDVVAQTTGTRSTFTVDEKLINQYIVAAGKTSSAGYTAYSALSDVYVNVLTKKISKKDFGIRKNGILASSNKFTAVAFYSGSGYEVEVSYPEAKGTKKFKSEKSYTVDGSYATVSYKEGKFMRYRVRAFVKTDNGVKYGSWSDYRAFCEMVNVKSSMKYGSKKINLSWKKVSGSGRFKIQVSTKKNSGYKTFATLKSSAKKATVTKCGKTKFKKGKTYYVRVIPEVKSGKKYIASDYISQSGAIKIR